MEQRAKRVARVSVGAWALWALLGLAACSDDATGEDAANGGAANSGGNTNSGGDANSGNANSGGGQVFDTPVCNYQDDPASCEGWRCYNEADRVVCERTDPDRPDGGGGWECSDDANPGYTTCVREDDAGGGAAGWECRDNPDGSRTCDRATPDDPDGAGQGWECRYDDAGVTCDRTDGPDGNPGWECADDASGTTCTTQDPSLRDDQPSGGQWECVTDGDTRTCHDDHDNDAPGASPDNPDGGAGWTCFNDSLGRHCHRDDPGGSDDGAGFPGADGGYDTPDGGPGWDCETHEGTRTCEEEDTPGGGNNGDGGGDDPNGGGSDGWDCEHDQEADRTVCVEEPDTPTEDEGWECYEEDDRRICEQDTPDGSDTPDFNDCGDPVGNINGRVCAPSGDFWVVGATVTVTYTDCNGAVQTLTTQTDEAGYFLLTGVPEGTHVVSVDKGPYHAEYEVTVTAGQTFTIPLGDFCFEQTTKIAVITGQYDQVEVVLDRLGFTYDLFQGYPNSDEARALIGDPARLAEYDVVFMNCGTSFRGIFDDPRVLAAVRTNLRAYIEEGGHMYVSDWDWLFVEEPFPDALDFFGGDGAQLDVLQGAAGYRPARVVDPELAAVLNDDQTTVQFDYPDWAIVEAASPDARVFLTASVERTRGGILRDVPVLMSFKLGAGEVIYTSYHIHQNQAINSIFTFTVLGFQ